MPTRPVSGHAIDSTPPPPSLPWAALGLQLRALATTGTARQRTGAMHSRCLASVALPPSRAPAGAMRGRTRSTQRAARTVEWIPARTTTSFLESVKAKHLGSEAEASGSGFMANTGGRPNGPSMSSAAAVNSQWPFGIQQADNWACQRGGGDGRPGPQWMVKVEAARADVICSCSCNHPPTRPFFFFPWPTLCRKGESRYILQFP